jgi:hypothetical protein
MLVYDTAKIAPRLDTRHVHEHRVLAKIPGEIIEQAARLTFGVFSPITDEDGAHVTLLRPDPDSLADSSCCLSRE